MKGTAETGVEASIRESLSLTMLDAGLFDPITQQNDSLRQRRPNESIDEILLSLMLPYHLNG